jgi:hypothetical protein
MRGCCDLCGRFDQLEGHHIFGGANRKRSERYGLKVQLCVECHRTGPEAAHRSAATAQKLHERGQRIYMREHQATIQDFIAAFGRNYLDETEAKMAFMRLRQILSKLYTDQKIEYSDYCVLWEAVRQAEEQTEEALKQHG